MSHRVALFDCRLASTVALAIGAMVANASAQQITAVQRSVFANTQFSINGQPGPWESSVASGNSFASQISNVTPTSITAEGALAGQWPIPGNASSSITVVFQLPVQSVVSIFGVLGGYTAGPSGLSKGNCHMTLSGPDGVLYDASGPLVPPFDEPLVTVGSLILPPGSYTLQIAGTAIAQGALPQNGVSMFAEFDFDIDIDPILCDGTGFGSCHIPHLGPKCEDVDCCQSVCLVDPQCCLNAWDLACVQIAAQLCDTPPSNDECGQAAPIGAGLTVVSTQAATGSLVLPQSCEEGFGTTIEKDVYFRYVPFATGPAHISTCVVYGFDTRLAVFSGSCEAPVLLACNDDTDECAMLGAELTFDAVEGEEYIIALGGYSGAEGLTALIISQGSEPPIACPADLIVNGAVDAADLAALLGAWGSIDSTYDLDGSGAIGAGDLAILLGSWGSCK